MKNVWLLLTICFAFSACNKSGSGAAATNKEKDEREVDPVVMEEERQPTFTVICDYPARGQCDEYYEVVESGISDIEMECLQDGLSEFYDDRTCEEVRNPGTLFGYCEKDALEVTSFHYEDSPQGCVQPKESCEDDGDNWTQTKECIGQ